MSEIPIPEEIAKFLRDLQENGGTAEEANEVMARNQALLAPLGWTFLCLNDGGICGQEWNLGCQQPGGGVSFCLQRFPDLDPPHDNWGIYTVEY